MLMGKIRRKIGEIEDVQHKHQQSKLRIITKNFSPVAPKVINKCLCEGKTSLLDRVVDLLNRVDVGGSAQVKTEVVLGSRLHDLLMIKKD